MFKYIELLGLKADKSKKKITKIHLRKEDKKGRKKKRKTRRNEKKRKREKRKKSILKS